MIGIIIVIYNSWIQAKQCIESIFSSNNKQPYQIYVVDNASPNIDSSIVNYLQLQEKVTLIRSDVNGGYSAGNNIGIKAAKNDFCKEILISNSDILFSDYSIDVMWDFLQGNCKVGIVGPKIMLPSGNIQQINMGIRTGMKEKYLCLLRKTLFAPLISKFTRTYCALDYTFKNPLNVYAVSGCCFMLSEKCINQIFPLDENTFLFEEEKIIGIKMEQAGFKTIYLPSSCITHLHEGGAMSAFQYTCFVSSELYYCKKYLNANSLQILPLYFVRTLKYLYYSTIKSEFRQNIKFYIKRTNFIHSPNISL